MHANVMSCHVQLAVGASHCVGLTQQRTVVVWGSNGHGQLGLGPGAPAEQLSPVEQPSLSALRGDEVRSREETVFHGRISRLNHCTATVALGAPRRRGAI